MPSYLHHLEQMREVAGLVRTRLASVKKLREDLLPYHQDLVNLWAQIATDLDESRVLSETGLPQVRGPLSQMKVNRIQMRSRVQTGEWRAQRVLGLSATEMSPVAALSGNTDALDLSWKDPKAEGPRSTTRAAVQGSTSLFPLFAVPSVTAVGSDSGAAREQVGVYEQAQRGSYWLTDGKYFLRGGLSLKLARAEPIPPEALETSCMMGERRIFRR
jgi:hypothetical protein